MVAQFIQNALGDGHRSLPPTMLGANGAGVDLQNSLLEHMAEPVILCTGPSSGLPDCIIQANPAAVDVLGLGEVMLPLSLANYLDPRVWSPTTWGDRAHPREGLIWSGELATRSGSPHPIELRAWIVGSHLATGTAADGAPVPPYSIELWVVLLRPRERTDEEARSHVRSLESQLLHAHKMEAMGRLAGGVAHDFNNLLTVINGHCDLLLRRSGLDEPLRRDLEDIRKAGERAGTLTRQLLTFSRRQRQQPKLVDPCLILTDLEKMLRRLIGEDVEIKLELGSDIGMVYVDPGQFEQLVINLAINARDAMPHGGMLRVQASTVQVRRELRWNEALIQPGEFIRIALTDTGLGIEPEVLQRIFEPFFTTKEVGRGTGLGLSIVYGVVLQSGGFIDVESTPGEGSTFAIHLPRMIRVDTPHATEKATRQLHHQGETIMVVEDDPMVRRMVNAMLQPHGYHVVLADGGEEALRLSEQAALRIDLLVTDLVLPRMNGLQLAERLRESRPGLRVLLMSGYSATGAQQLGAMPSNLDYLAKPFTARSLEQKIREILDRKAE